MKTPIPKNLKNLLEAEFSESKCSICGLPINMHGNIESIVFGSGGGGLICPASSDVENKREVLK